MDNNDNVLDTRDKKAYESDNVGDENEAYESDNEGDDNGVYESDNGVVEHDNVV